MSKRIALYARVSSERQADEGTVDSQLGALQDYATNHGYDIDSDLVFVDNGISGTTLIRPALDRLRDKAVAGQIDRVLVLCPDRLARKHVHQLVLVEELNRLGVEIEFTNRTISQSPEDQLLFQIQGVIAEFEREKIVERCRRGKDHKARAGKVNVLVAAPYGYVYIRRTEAQDARYEIHPEEAKIVQSVYAMLTVERMSTRQIAVRLSAENIPPRRGGASWNPSTIGKMLRNPAYIGKAAFHKSKYVPRERATKQAYDHSYYPRTPNSSQRARPQEEWIYIPVPKIIDEKTFNCAQEQLKQNIRFAPRNNKKNHYLLNGLLRCKLCGYAMYGKPALSSKNKLVYYRCLGLDRHRCQPGTTCTGHPVRAEVLDDAVWGQTRKLIEQPEIVFQEYSDRLQKKEKQELDIQALIAKKDKELRYQENEKQRLLDLYQAGRVTLDEISTRLDTIRHRVLKIQQEHALLKEGARQKHQTLQLIEQFQTFKLKFADNLDALSFEKKKQVIRLLVDEVSVDSNAQNITVKHIVPMTRNFPLRPLTARSWCR